jgi:peptidoglycan DL-endopeptidase CwlO
MHLDTEVARRVWRRLAGGGRLDTEVARRLFRRLTGSARLNTGLARWLWRRLTGGVRLNTGLARRLWRRLAGGGRLNTGLARRLCRRLAGRGRLVTVLASVLVVAGSAAGAILAAMVLAGGGSEPTGWTGPPPPAATPTGLASTSAPVVPLLGGIAGAGRPLPVALASPAANAGTPARVAPLHALRRADLLVVAPFSLPAQVVEAVSRLPGVTGADSIEAAKVKINGAYTAVLGVDPSTFRGYAPRLVAESNALWQGVADGGIAVSYTMGTLDRLPLGGGVTVTGSQPVRLPVVAFGTVGIGGVDAVVSDSTARSLGIPLANAIVVSAPPASVASLARQIRGVVPRGTGVEPLVTVIMEPAAAGVTPPIGGTYAGAMTVTELTVALRAAESRQGLPYVWGSAGPSAFDCSGLVQWSFAQAGIRMPRVAADQARTGPAVPLSQLEPGDLLFYRTDPTAPGYISHVAIYLGSGWMIQAPEPGLSVQLVQADFGPEFAGAVRVYPQIAAAAAAGLA